ncbi:MAG: PaaI family thioesterase [Actinomycetota bacterium]
MRFPLNHPLGRFGIEIDDDDPDQATASVPTAGLLNPLTGLPTIAPLAMLVDHVAGAVNHARRGAGEWTVSSELALEVAPGAPEAIAAAPERPVIGMARPVGPKGTTALALCELSVTGVVIATATVRSFYIPAPAEFTTWPDDPTAPAVGARFADRMAVEVGETGGAATVLMQRDDRAVYNGVGMVHGGVSSMGLELVASAAINKGTDIGTDTAFVTGSLRVNFLRPMHGGAGAHYSATPARIGRRSAVADAVAVGSDGRPALVGRLTGYR